MQEIPAEPLSRLALLERQVAGLKRAVVRISVVFFLFFTSILLFYSKTASVRWLAINDSQKRMEGWWDEKGIALHSNSGIRFYDEKGVPRLTLGMVGNQPGLQMFDRDGTMKAQIFIYPDGAAYLMLWDKDGHGVRFPPPEKPLP